MQKDSDAANVVRVDFKVRKASVANVPSDDVQENLNSKKRELFDRWIALGTVCLLFDARQKAVKVPVEFKARGDLRLNFCYGFQVADFNFNANGVWGSLSFDSGEFFCMIPWEHVYGMQSAQLNQGAVWFESFPEDYDQVEVLGFSEEMCESIADVDSEVSKPSDAQMDNVVKLDFSKNSLS